MNVPYPIFYERRFGGDDFHYLHRASYGFAGPDRHLHDYYELYMVRHGQVNYNVEGHTYSLRDSELIVTNPKEFHCPLYQNESYIEMSFIAFKPLFVPFILSDSFNPLDAIDNRRLGHGNKIDAVHVRDNNIIQLFDEIEAELKTDLPRNKLVVMGKFTELLCRVAEVMPKSSTEYRTNRKVHDIVKYINDNLENDLQAEDLSRHFYLEKNYLRNLFKKETGYTIRDYVQQKRIFRALEFLAEGENANTVARIVGYKDYTTFYRAFKRVTGVAPGEHKQIKKI